MVNCKSSQTLSAHNKQQNYHHNDLGHSASINDQRTNVRKKKSDLILNPKLFLHSKSPNIHLINNSISTRKIKNAKASKIRSEKHLPNLQGDNDDSLIKLFGATRNKHHSDNHIMLKSKELDLKKSFAKKVKDFEKSRKKIKKFKSRRYITNPSLKTRLDDIYPDSMKNIGVKSPFMKLIRTKRFGDAGHELKKYSAIKKNDHKSKIVKQRWRNLKKIKKASDNSKVSKLLEDLLNLGQTIITKITEIRGSMNVMKRDSHEHLSAIDSTE
ncbi:hypothetical protein PV326_000228 [Microctonus aethiopoides]|nr:hypothetical protein PV326_000228 [Microctonus aethiopoides]